MSKPLIGKKCMIKLFNIIAVIVYLTLCLPRILFDVIRIYIKRFQGLTGEYDYAGRYLDPTVAEHNCNFSAIDMSKHLDQEKKRRHFEMAKREEEERRYSKLMDGVVEAYKAR